MPRQCLEIRPGAGQPLSTALGSNPLLCAHGVARGLREGLAGHWCTGTQQTTCMRVSTAGTAALPSTHSVIRLDTNERQLGALLLAHEAHAAPWKHRPRPGARGEAGYCNTHPCTGWCTGGGWLTPLRTGGRSWTLLHPRSAPAQPLRPRGSGPQQWSYSPSAGKFLKFKFRTLPCIFFSLSFL